jgi:hypothetical protein
LSGAAAATQASRSASRSATVSDSDSPFEPAGMTFEMLRAATNSA